MGRKLEMTQIFSESGIASPVTKVEAYPCTVVQVKTAEKDSYDAIQFGCGEKKEKNIAKPQRLHMKGLGNFRYLKELRMKSNLEVVKRGDVVDASNFVAGDIVGVTSTSKGKGFQGVVKRYGFHGSLATHGHKDQIRMPGSIGATGPAHVFKGTRMGGHMGNEQVTVKNLEIIEVDEKNNFIYIKGAVPGARNGLVTILGDGEMKVAENKKEVKSEKEENSEKQIVNSENGQDEKTEEKIEETVETKKLETTETKNEEKVTEKKE